MGILKFLLGLGDSQNVSDAGQRKKLTQKERDALEYALWEQAEEFADEMEEEEGE